MAARSPRPVWINLEYLSAESWVDGCHGLPSPHPGLPLVKHFFFPGFTSVTGGLLRESGLTKVREAFQSDPAAIAAFWRSLEFPERRHGARAANCGHEPVVASLPSSPTLLPGGEGSVVLPSPLGRGTEGEGRFMESGALRVSFFCYRNAALPALVHAWSSDRLPVVCIVPDGAALAQLSQIAGQRIAPGSRIELGGLSIAAIPFLDLDQYDRLLWACDLNFVRGEDSFVRAQFAARPLVWQAYPQDESAHLSKSAAFLARYASALGPAAGSVYCAFAEAWNRESTDAGRHWAALRGHREALAAHARNWAGNLAAGGSLAIKLAEFCEDRLK